MALENNDLRTVFSGNSPGKRMIPKEGGGTAVGELAVHSGAPLLPEGTPLAFNSSSSKWQVYTQPSDAAIYTLTRDAGAGDGGSLTLYIDGLAVVLDWDEDTAGVLAKVNAVLAAGGRPYAVTVANSGSGTDLGVSGNIQTITLGEAAGAPVVDVDSSGLTDGGLNEPTGILLATVDAGTALNETNIIRAFVGDEGGVETSATDEVQVLLFKAGTVHRDDVNNAAILTVLGGSPSAGELDAALVAQGVRDDGIDVQDIVGVN